MTDCCEKLVEPPKHVDSQTVSRYRRLPYSARKGRVASDSRVSVQRDILEASEQPQDLATLLALYAHNAMDFSGGYSARICKLSGWQAAE